MIAFPTDDTKHLSVRPQHNVITTYDVHYKRDTSLTKNLPVTAVHVQPASDTNKSHTIPYKPKLTSPYVAHTTTPKD